MGQVHKAKVSEAELAELKFLQEQEIATTRELALGDLWLLMSEVLWPAEMEEHFQEDFHKPIADRVTAAQPGCRDLLLAPRASRKTMLRLVAHVVWRILRDPNIRILIVSALDDTAKKFLGIIKTQFQKNVGIKKYFPEFVLPTKIGTEYEFTHPLRTNINLIDPTVRATYLGAPFLGRRCLTPDSLVVCSSGLVPIGDIKSGDFVLTHEGTYRRVIGTARRRHKGNVVTLKVMGHPSTSTWTPDHRVLARVQEEGLPTVKWVEVGTLQEGDYLLFPVGKNGGSHNIFKEPDRQAWFAEVSRKPEFWRLLGYYMAEGYTADNDGHRVKLAFRLGEEWIDDVEACVVECLGITIHKYDRPHLNVCEVAFCHELFRAVVGTFGRKAHLKQLPYWVERTTFVNKAEFIKGYWRGDGCSTAQGKASATSASLGLLLGIQRLLSSREIPSSLTKLRDAHTSFIRGRKIWSKQAWALNVDDPTFHSVLNYSWQARDWKPKQNFFDSDWWYCRVREVFISKYSGDVVDLKVDGVASFVTPDAVNHNCDLLVLDDPIDDKHVATPDQADKSLQWINVLFPLVDRNPRYNMVFVNATRKAFNDPYAAMLGESRGDDAKEELTEPPFASVTRGALEDAEGHSDINGTPTFAKVLSKEVLMQELARARMDPRLGESYFFREYLNLCQSPGSKKFYEEWFDTWTPVLPTNIVWGGIAFDSALKDKAVNVGGDFTVMLVAHFDAHGHLYFTDGARSDRWRTMDFLRELAAMAQRNGGTYNVLKQKVGEDPLAGVIEHYFHELRMPVTIYALTVAHEGSKIVRNINALQGPLQARKIHFVGDPATGRGFPAALWRVLRDEACHIGQWSHDDGIDAMSCFFHKDVRVIPSSGKAVEWKPMHNARLMQGSTAQFNLGAVRTRMKVAAPTANPWEQRAMEEFQRALGVPGGVDMKRPPVRALPFTLVAGKDGEVW